MKRSVLIIFYIFIFQLSFAQFQSQRDTNDIEIKEVRSTLDKATGYTYLGGGEWATAKNKIPYIQTQKSAEGASDASMSRRESRKIKRKLRATKAEKKLGKVNFEAMELRDIIINGQAFQLLQVRKEKGNFEFPLIKEGFSTYEVMDYYVFRADRLEQVLPSPLVFNKPYVVDLKVFVSDEIPYYKTKNIDALISKKVRSTIFSRQMESFSTTNLLLTLYPTVDEGEKRMRFNLINSYNKPYVTRSYYNEKNLKELFNTKFFETDFESFKDFIGTPSISFQYSDSQPTTFEGYCELGLNQYQYGDYYNAVANLNKALRMRPDYDHFEVYSHRANAKYRLGDLYGALDDYNQALDYRPEEQESQKEWLKNYMNRGVVKYHLGDRSEACSDWKRAYEQGVAKAGEYLEKHCQ
jgi:hypothetical protein